MRQFLLVLACAGWLAAGFGSAAHAAVINVPLDYPTIQAAIDAAQPGDRIDVQPGVYNEQLTINTEDLQIRSISPGNPDIVATTVIDGTGLTGSLVTFQSGAASGTSFEGFTIRNGNTLSSGGGMRINGASPEILFCVFENNEAGVDGGGASVAFGAPVFFICTFIGNEANGDGGGVSVAQDTSGTRIDDCAFFNNTAGSRGGGVNVVFSADTLIDLSVFEGNAATRGGGVAAAGAQVVIEDCNFNGNNAAIEGGGVIISNTPGSTIDDCTFTANTATDGGGLACGTSGNVMMEVRDSTFTGNVASSDGGGMYSEDDLTITNCSINTNTANLGGGLFVRLSAEVAVHGCNIDDNVANDDGGGVYVGDSSLTMNGGRLRGNHAGDDGGGLASGQSSEATLNGVRVFENTANGDGGGIALRDEGNVVNCLIFANAAVGMGGGVFTDSPLGGAAQITNTTIYANDASGGAGGLAADTGLTQTRSCIIWGNSGTQVGPGGLPDVTYSLVQGGYAGIGNISADPLFRDPLGTDGVAGTNDDDLRLGAFSPAIDAGSNNAAGLSGVTTDFDGLPRFYDDADVSDSGAGAAPIVDMGAFERQSDSAAVTVTLSPADSIQAAIDSVAEGSTIILQTGTYQQSFNTNGKAITIRSADPLSRGTVNNTRIQPPAPGERILTINSNEGPDTVISGITFRFGDAEDGAALQTAQGASPTISHCVFFQNVAGDDGGAVRVRTDSQPMFLSCGFYGNSAGDDGGAVFLEAGSSDAMFINCVFVGNIATDQGGAIDGNSADPTILNCTFHRNESIDGGAYHRSNSGNPVITNSIFWQGVPNEFDDDGANVSYSIVEGGYPGVGNLNVDPMFTDPDGPNNTLGTPDDNLSLRPFSPAIDAGNNSVAELMGVTSDFVQNDRFYDDVDVADTGNGAAPIIDIGAYESNVPSAPQVLNIGPADSIQTAVDSVANGSEIILAPGVYPQSFNTRGKAITVRSENPTDPGVVAATILDGEGVRRLINVTSNEGADTVIAGLTLRNGSAGAGGAVRCNNSSDPTFRWCRFVNNHATTSDGGAVDTNTLSSPQFYNCAFIGNTADNDGGAVEFQNADTIFVNCLFSGNVAGDRGGAVYATSGSDDDFINCTFVNNIAGSTGGAIGRNASSDPTIVNSILWGNVPDEIETQDNPATVTFSIVTGGFPGEGNLDVDPLFMDADGADDTPGTEDDDARLSPASPAVEIGFNDAVPVDVTLDLDANDRFFDADGDRIATVDLGAYELQASIGCLGDLDGDQTVGASDLAVLLAAWGACDDCPADLNGDGFVSAADLAVLLAAWGPCD